MASDFHVSQHLELCVLCSELLDLEEHTSFNLLVVDKVLGTVDLKLNSLSDGAKRNGVSCNLVVNNDLPVLHGLCLDNSRELSSELIQLTFICSLDHISVLSEKLWVVREEVKLCDFTI